MSNRPPLPLPTDQQKSIYWGRLFGCAQAETLVRSLPDQGSALVVLADANEALQWHKELSFFASSRFPVHLLNDWETLPYDIFSPAQDLVTQRLKVLSALQNRLPGIFVVAASTLMQRLPPAEFITTQEWQLTVGQTIDFDQLRKSLDEHGYTCVSQVSEPGEYAVRGSVVDIFTADAETGIRVDAMGDTIESLRRFDPNTQLSTEKVKTVKVLSAREFPLTAEAIKRFRENFRKHVDSPPGESYIYQEVSQGRIPAGIENYLPLFFERMVSLFDYLSPETYVFHHKDLHGHCKQHWQRIQTRYKQTHGNVERPSLLPQQLYLNPEQIEDACRHIYTVTLSSGKRISNDFVDGGTRILPALAWQKEQKEPAKPFRDLMQKAKRILVVAESMGYQEQLIELFGKEKIHLKRVSTWDEFCNQELPCCICIGEIHAGTWYEMEAYAIVADHQILNRKLKQRYRRRKHQAAVFQDLSELQTGCPVVHEKYGVGRYQGLQTLNVGGTLTEFMVLHYANEEKLYVPIVALDLVTRYLGDPDSAPLHDLGGEQWNKVKRKVAKKVFDVAAELLDTQTRRQRIDGIHFKLEEAEYAHFADLFPFEETPDQQSTIDEVLADMQKEQPMDRVVCGDVGFGKTEIAMRAAYLAAANHYQTALLVPTTLLADQHYQSFLTRFAEHPIQIEVYSRFLSTTRQQQVRAAMAAGNIDIIIGTHKLLGKHLQLERLGLIVIDEEHRFGVRAKEQLKSTYPHCDILTLTATPIPRTLSMSLSGLRDLSIIATPPPHRLAIRTFISEWSDELISESCHRELHRGGQVYFLHNNIKTIEEITDKLKTLMPNASIEFVHGQLPERALEHIMYRFYHKHIDILVCTTIIESGLDVPNANSIIINEAENLGLSQLHQLRGRVGRSHHRAYAYLLIGAPRPYLTADAVKRLEAIESLEELGTGFTLASQDLEIRGAGELLGQAQSGHIQEIGFTLYNKMLNHAIDTLKSGQVPDFDKPLNIISEINLGEPAIIPEDYIPDVHLRLILYRRIAATNNLEEIEALKRELIDRFGRMPSYCQNLLVSAQLRLGCRDIGIQQLEASATAIRIKFGEEAPIDFAALIEMVQADAARYAFTQSNCLLVRVATEDLEQKLEAIESLLKELKCLKSR